MSGATIKIMGNKVHKKLQYATAGKNTNRILRFASILIIFNNFP